MSVGERIKDLREELGITQEEFSQRLGATRNTITNYEANRRTPMDATIKSICREFNVNETWLRTGEGEMFVPIAQDQTIFNFIEQVLQCPEDDFRRRFISTLPELTESDWAAFERLFSLIENAP